MTKKTINKTKKSNNKPSNKKQDKISTTGHSWDGIEEYNTPAPRWWLIVWIITIIFSIIYWFFYPSWPTKQGNNKGIKNWSSVLELTNQQKEIQKRKAIYSKRFNKASFDEIMQDRELMEFALIGGKTAFKENCTACHGSDASGQKGFPNLNDDDWLWGGKIEDIYQTLKYGIRSNHENTRISQMPRFGLDEILNKDEIETVAKYALSLSNNHNNSNNFDKKTNQKGHEIFNTQCAVCHGQNGKGNKSLGAPDLTDVIWLYGKNKEDIIHSINYSRNGVMPNWNERLNDDTIRQLAIYVHSLGGGK